MKKFNFGTILKAIEIATTTAVGIGSIIATLKAARLTEEQMDTIAEKTATKVLAKEQELILACAPINEEENISEDEVINDVMGRQN